MEPEEYLAAKQALLLNIEAKLTAQIEPELERALVLLEDLDEESSDDQWEQALGRLNDDLKNAISRELFTHQREIARLAVSVWPGTPARMMTPAEILSATEMAGKTLDEWFRRRSPSQWMRGLFGTTARNLIAQVETAIATAVWDMSSQVEVLSWSASSRYRWFTKEDEKVCELCGPLEGTTYADLESVPERPHPKCRCSWLPESE